MSASAHGIRSPRRVYHRGVYSRQALKISFPPPGFFLVDVRVVMHLDGAVVYEGGFKQGFEVELPVTPGRHVLGTAIDLGAIQRRREYPIEVLAGQARHIVLRYSRFWGNFTSELAEAGTPSSDRAGRFRWALAALAFVIVSPAAAFLAFFLAVTIAPPYTPEGYAVMPTGQLLLALLLAPFIGALAAALVGRTRSR